jgi:hypothetical protein
MLWSEQQQQLGFASCATVLFRTTTHSNHFKIFQAERCKSQSQYCPKGYTSCKFSDHTYRQDRMGKMPSTRQLRASVSFPIIELGLQEALEGVSFAKARRSHKSVQI